MRALRAREQVFYLGVGRLSLLDRLIVLVARRDLPREVVVDARQPLGQDPQIILDLGCGSAQAGQGGAGGGAGVPRAENTCHEARVRHGWKRMSQAATRGGLPARRTLLLLVLRDRPIHLLTLLAQILNACAPAQTERVSEGWHHRRIRGGCGCSSASCVGAVGLPRTFYKLVVVVLQGLRMGRGKWTHTCESAGASSNVAMRRPQRLRQHMTFSDRRRRHRCSERAQVGMLGSQQQLLTAPCVAITPD